ncbi:AAA-type ATPase lid domain-containing protein [Methylomagnum sp.]
MDARIVAATHGELEPAVAEGGFRKDLYYRINVVKLVIPPLAERRDDIPPLVELILKRLAAPIRGITPELMERLRAYAWPGNVRELENTLERAVLFAAGPELAEAELGGETASETGTDLGFKALRKQMLGKLGAGFTAAVSGRCRAGGRGHGTDPTGGIFEAEGIGH